MQCEWVWCSEDMMLKVGVFGGEWEVRSKARKFLQGATSRGKFLEQLEHRAHNLLSSWNHTAGVHSQKLYCT